MVHKTTNTVLSGEWWKWALAIRQLKDRPIAKMEWGRMVCYQVFNSESLPPLPPK